MHNEESNKILRIYESEINDAKGMQQESVKDAMFSLFLSALVLCGIATCLRITGQILLLQCVVPLLLIHTFYCYVKMKVTEKPLKFFDPETLEKATFKIEADKLRIDVAKNNSFLLPIVHIMGYKSPVIIFLDHCCILPEGIEYIENVEMIHDHGDRSEWDQFAVELINTIDIAIEKMEANQK